MINITKHQHKRLVLASGLLAALVVISHVNAAVNNSQRIETTKTADTHKVSVQKKEAPKTPKNASEPALPVPAPAPAPVDPNGCEAQGMHWRADNYECIVKAEPVEPEAVTAPVTTQSSESTASSGSGDCSLVNNYDWPVATAYRVCMQESGGNSNNANWTDPHPGMGCSGSFGLFQINCSYGTVFDGPANVAIAYQMWSSAGGTFSRDWTYTCSLVGC